MITPATNILTLSHTLPQIFSLGSTVDHATFCRISVSRDHFAATWSIVRNIKATSQGKIKRKIFLCYNTEVQKDWEGANHWVTCRNGKGQHPLQTSLAPQLTSPRPESRPIQASNQRHIMFQTAGTSPIPKINAAEKSTALLDISDRLLKEKVAVVMLHLSSFIRTAQHVTPTDSAIKSTPSAAPYAFDVSYDKYACYAISSFISIPPNWVLISIFPTTRTMVTMTSWIKKNTGPRP